MFQENEKDYIMRMINEMVRILFSLLFGKQYAQVDLPLENKYSISGTGLDEWKAMVDRGEINEAENLLLEHIDYSNRNELAAAILFYEYVSQQEETFLEAHRYSLAEAMDGLKQIAEKSGYGELCHSFKLSPD